MSSPSSSKLSVKEKVGYGLGDTASNIFFFGVNAWIFFYYTEVCKIPPATVGTLLLVPRLWDAISDPLMGALADRTRTRMGTYRPYLLWLAVPFGIFGYLTFAVPDIEPSGKLIYAYVTYILLMTAYTAINVPYSALMGTMTPVPKERTSLATFRFVGAFSGQLIISMSFLPLVLFFGKGDKTLGFPRAMAVMAVLATIMFLITFFTTRERVKPLVEKSDIKGDFLALLNNRPWVIMVIAAFLTLSSAAIRWTILPQYLKYYFGVGEEPYVWFMDKITFVQTASSLAFIAGVFMTGFFARRFGKRNSLIGLTTANGIIILLLFFIPRDGYTTFVALSIVGNILAGPTPALVWSMYTDVADYGELKSGRRVTGLAFSAAMFSQKLGISLGGSACGWILGGVGFVAGAAPGDSIIQSFRVLACIIPGVLAIANGIVLFWYNLGEEEVEEIVEKLAERRKDD
jgi:glycoside/pentoside/hexuronide:cation symporter, GPH family